jgi:diguanylate cyclase (GGDEF)-like protein
MDSETGAEMGHTLQDLGSPGALLQIVVDSDTAFGVSTIRETEGEEIHAGEWMIRERFEDGFEPFREFCAFTAGLLAILPRLFGLPLGEVVEEQCSCDGAPTCTFRVNWQTQSDVLQEKNYFETRSRLLEARLDTLQHTVSDLVSAPNPDEGMSRVLSAIARAMYAPSYVLVTDPSLPMSQRLLYLGLDATEAERIGRELPRQSGRDIPGRLVVEVASTRSRYGWLAAIDPGSRHFLVQERDVLDSYAGLAAAALDSATALEEAQRQAATTGTLLDLSSSLARVLSTEEMAFELARAVPSIVDCDRSMVLLSEPGRDETRVVASFGYSSETSDQLQSVRISQSLLATMSSDVAYFDSAQISLFHRTYGLSVKDDSAAIAFVPMVANGAMIGGLIVTVADQPTRLRESSDLSDTLRGLAGQAAVAICNARLVDQIRHQAMHDGLTGLPNRTLVLDRMERSLARARRGQHPIAAMFIDLDGFKEINDTLGHAVGDKVLCVLADRFEATLRQEDTIGRLGGDEFIAILEGPSLVGGHEAIAERILDAARSPFEIEGVSAARLSITTSIGIALGDRTTGQELLRDADIALYRAKASGKDCYMTYGPEMDRSFRDCVDTDPVAPDSVAPAPSHT